MTCGLVTLEIDIATEDICLAFSQPLDTLLEERLKQVRKEIEVDHETSSERSQNGMLHEGLTLEFNVQMRLVSRDL